MKNRTWVRVLSLLLVLVLALGVMTSCTGKGPDAGQMTLVIHKADGTEDTYKVDLDKVEITEGVASVIKYLGEKEGLKYDISGTFLNSIGALNPDPSCEYVCVRTSVAADRDVSGWISDLDYKGTTLYGSGFGIFEMHVEADCIVYFSIEGF